MQNGTQSWQYNELVRGIIGCDYCVMKGRLTFCIRQWKFSPCSWIDKEMRKSLFSLFLVSISIQHFTVVNLSLNETSIYMIQWFGEWSIFLLLLFNSITLLKKIRKRVKNRHVKEIDKPSTSGDQFSFLC